MNPILVQFIRDNLAFVIITGIAIVGVIAAAIILIVTARRASAGNGFFVGVKRLAVKYSLSGWF